MARHNRIVDIRVDELKIHPVAQRKLVPAQLRKRMVDLDLDAIGVLHGVELDDGINIIDGQHRYKALMNHGFGEWKVRVELHPDATDDARASALFLRLNAKSTVSPYDMFENEVVAGDPIAVQAKRIAEKHGLKVDRQGGDGHITCVSTMKKVVAKDDGVTFDDALGILVAANGHTAAAVEGKLVEGLAIVCFKHNGALDHDVLIKKLSKYPGGASKIVGRGKGMAEIRSSSLPLGIAEVILAAYNSGRRDANKLSLA